MALGCPCRSFGLALGIRRSAVYWLHAAFAEVLACCRGLRVIVDNRHQVGRGMAVLDALGHQDGSGTVVSGALGIKLALDWPFRTLLAVKLALVRWFRERLGVWGDPKGVPGCREARPITPELTLRGRKSMPSGI